MKASELLAVLQTISPDTEIVLSSDGEGNQYTFLRGTASASLYDDSDAPFLDIYDSDTDGIAWLEECGWSTEEISTLKPCVVLYPIV